MTAPVRDTVFVPLSNTHPQVAMTWHPEFNRIVTPADIAADSTSTLWWLCTCGASFQRVVKDRVADDGRCDSCRTANPR